MGTLFPWWCRRCFEYRTTGPGAVTSPNRRVLSDGEAQTYTGSSGLEGWVPKI
jgi:pectinesterase